MKLPSKCTVIISLERCDPTCSTQIDRVETTSYGQELLEYIPPEVGKAVMNKNRAWNVSCVRSGRVFLLVSLIGGLRLNLMVLSGESRHWVSPEKG